MVLQDVLCLLYEAFKSLEPDLSADEEISYLRTNKNYITPKICLHCALQWLAGASYMDACLYAGISVSSFYWIVYKCFDASNNCP